MATALFPQQPYGYLAREHYEEEIIDRLTKQNLVVITNQDTELCATGKSSIASSICSNQRVRDYFFDGMLWLSLNRFFVLNASTYDFFLQYLFEELRRHICPTLDAILFNHSIKSKIMDNKSTSSSKQLWESAIHQVLATLGPKPKYLVVLDNLPNKSVLQSLESLGMTLIVTIQSSACTPENNVCISAILEKGMRRSIFDIMEDSPSRSVEAAASPSSSFVCSLSTLLQSAYKLGYSDNSERNGEVCPHIPPGSLVVKLLCHFSTLSHNLKERFLLLSSLPTGVFLPVTLVYFIWSSASVQGQTASKLSKEEDILYLFSLSLIQLSANKEMVLLTPESKRFMAVIFAQETCSPQSVRIDGAANDRLSALREDALEILEYALINDKTDFLSFQFDQYAAALWGCFESVNWKDADVIEKYTCMFEKEMESSQFAAKNYLSQMMTLTSLEHVIRVLFKSKELINTQKADSFNVTLINVGDAEDFDCVTNHDITEKENFMEWCRTFSEKIVHNKDYLFELYHDHDMPPLDFCDSLALLAEISTACGLFTEATVIRKRIISIQREYLPDDDMELGKSLLLLACCQFYSISRQLRSTDSKCSSEVSYAPTAATHLKTNAKNASRGDICDTDTGSDAMAIKEVESMCRLALRCFQEYNQSFPVVTMTDVSLSLLADILALQGERSLEIMDILQELLIHRKQFYSDVYHAQVADVYGKLAQVSHSSDNGSSSAVKLMNKKIRIVRQIYGDCHINTAEALECLAQYFLTEQFFERAETLLSKSIGIQQILYQRDPYVKESLASSRNQLSAVTAARLSAEQKPKQQQDDSLNTSSSVEKFKSSMNGDIDRTSGQKRALGRTKEDAVLLIALADRIFKKEANYAKAKKYIYKALKILSQCSNTNRSNDEQLLTSLQKQSAEIDSNIANNIVKWSAYNKLADICSCEDNVQEAAKLYQRALKGFLSINVTVSPERREQKAEAIVIAYNMATLVDNAMGFQAAESLYHKVVEIVAQVNTVIADAENGSSMPITPVCSAVHHASTLAFVADRVEANLHLNPNTPTSNATDSAHDDPNPAHSGVSTVSFLLRTRTMALAIFCFHLKPGDELIIQCQENLDRLCGTDSLLTTPHVHVKDSDKHANTYTSQLIDSVENREDKRSEQSHPSLSKLLYSPVEISTPIDVGHSIPPQEEIKMRHSETEMVDVMSPGNSYPEDTVTNIEVKSKGFVSPSPQEPENLSSISPVEEETVNVFAFGCCRRNQLHSSLLNGYNTCSYLGTTSSTEKFFMFVNKHDGKPFITTEPLPSEYAGVSKGVSCVIIGEVYSIPISLLQSMHDDISAVKCAVKTLSIKPLQTDVTNSGELSATNQHKNSSSRYNNKAHDMVSEAFFHVVPDVTKLSENFIANCRNIPRGNYTEFIRARGGIEAFIENSKSSLK